MKIPWVYRSWRFGRWKFHIDLWHGARLSHIDVDNHCVDVSYHLEWTDGVVGADPPRPLWRWPKFRVFKMPPGFKEACRRGGERLKQQGDDDAVLEHKRLP